MASFASSLHFLSLSPHSPSISNTRSSLSSSLSLSLSSLKVISASTSNGPLLLHFSSTPSASRLVARNFAVSSELGLEEEVSGGEPSFPPDLKVFVGNLPFTVDSATLAGLFGQAGNVEMVEVIYDKFTGRSRGFGFVTMSTVEEAEGAAQQFNGYELEGRALRVNYGPPPPKDESSSFRGPRGGGSFDNNNRIHVSNLAWDVDDLALSNLFSEQGKVVEARVINDRETGRSRGFGFVTYNSAEEVTNAIESLDGVDLNGRSIRVSVAEARQRRSF